MILIILKPDFEIEVDRQTRVCDQTFEWVSTTEIYWSAWGDQTHLWLKNCPNMTAKPSAATVILNTYNNLHRDWTKICRIIRNINIFIYTYWNYISLSYLTRNIYVRHNSGDLNDLERKYGIFFPENCQIHYP